MAASMKELTSFVIEPEYIVESRGEASDDASGSYGFVYEVKVKGVVRIAKKPHRFFLKKASEAERASVLASFKKECVLLNKLRHPNVVKFVGVYFGEGGEDDISMVMEKVHFELASFLRENSDVQLATKLSILQDVSYGLVYLHEYNPPIIHRDLTARNILLTKAYQAKIADVGVAKLLDQTAMKAASHTKAPGQMFYMPPEACMEKAECTSKLDIFSFGHLSLHVLLEDYPEVFEVKITSKMISDGTVQIMKRKSTLDRIENSHCLYPLITQCLMDEPEKRPSTRDVNSSIADIKEANSSDVGEFQSELRMEHHSHDMASILDKCLHESKENSVQVTNLAEKRELSKKLEERDKAILALQQESNVIIRKNQDLEAKCARMSKSKNRDLADQAPEVKELREYLEMQSRAIAKLKDDFGFERRAEIEKYQELEDERNRLKEDFQSARETIDQLRNEISSSRQRGLASLPDTKELSVLKEELVTARLNISSSEKMMEQLRKERDTALDECAIAGVQAETYKADFEAERKDRERAQGLLAGFKNKISTVKMYEKAIANHQQELHAVNQKWMDSKRKLYETEVELKKCKSRSSVAVIEHFKTNLEKVTQEKEHYYHENERSKSSLRDMGKIKGELKSMKDIVKQLRKEMDNKAREISSLKSAVKNKERQLVKAKQKEEEEEVKTPASGADTPRSQQYIGQHEAVASGPGPQEMPMAKEHNYKQGFQIEQQQEYKSEEIFGKKSSHCDRSESLPDPFYSLETAETIPEGLGYLVPNKEKAIWGERAKAVEGDFHSTMAVSSSEESSDWSEEVEEVKTSASGGDTPGGQQYIGQQEAVASGPRPQKIPMAFELSYKQGFQIEQQQEYKSEGMFGKKSSHCYPLESSQIFPDPFYNPDTAETIPERPKHLAYGVYPPGYLVTKNEKAICGENTKAVEGDSQAIMAESSSEESNDDQLHKDIDEEIHRFAEEVSEQVNRDSSHQVTEVQLPLDPNLVCPICHKNFRIGQIQKFSEHVENCD